MRGTIAKVESLLIQHPAVPLALRAAVAAVLAWLVVVPLGGPANDYPYYAPLGAFVGVSTSVLSSIRSSVQTFLALGCGGCIGMGLLSLDLPEPLAIGCAVGVGTVVGSWPVLGAKDSWVPMSALFILVLGQGSPWHFVLGYLGLTTLGAAVGVAVSLAAPPLHIAETAHAQDTLREAIVHQLESVAGGLDGDRPPTGEEWRERRRDVEREARQVQELVETGLSGPRINWRVRRWQDSADHLHAQGRALAHLAFQVDDLTDLLADRERADAGDITLGPALRPAAARALRATAGALRTVEGPAAAEEEYAEAWQSLDRLAAAVQDEQDRPAQALFAAGALVTGLSRVLESVDPRRG